MDGTSNTIAMSETATQSAFWPRDVRSGAVNALPWNVGTVVGTSRQSCLNSRNGDELKAGVIATTSVIMEIGTNCAFSALPFHSTFCTINPPNSPKCMAGTGDNEDQPGLLPPSSYHTGGVTVLLFDGSVRFVMDTVDCGPALAEPDRAGGTQANGPYPVRGPSVYGVWGAMGSPNGGESASL